MSTLSGILRDEALERGGIHSLFNDTNLFGQFTGGSYVLRERFIKDDPNASRMLVEGVSRTIAWAQTIPAEEVRARFDRIIADRKRYEDGLAIKYWKSAGARTARPSSSSHMASTRPRYSYVRIHSLNRLSSSTK